MRAKGVGWIAGAALTIGAVLGAASPAAAGVQPTPPPAPSFPTFPTPPAFPGSSSGPAATASLSGDTLSITGAGADDIISLSPSDVVTSPTSAVRGGTTSVGLDLALLQQAAGLTLTGSSTPGRPAGGDFQVGFPILPTTDFRYTPTSFAPVSGAIRHSGTITFNNSVTVGNFDVRFDPARATNGRSGFYIASTTGVVGILFDLGTPGPVTAVLNRLALGATPLLVSPEFAGVLGKPALTGAAVGKARIDALSTPAAGRQIAVTLKSSFSAPFRTAFFPASQVKNVVIAAGDGRNSITVVRLDIPGELRITGGAGDDTVLVNESIAGGAVVQTRSGGDLVSFSSDVFVSTAVDFGDGNDRSTFQGSLFTGARAVQGGAGTDSTNLFRTDLTRDALVGVEYVQQG